MKPLPSSHYPNQWCLANNSVLRHSPKDNDIGNAQESNNYTTTHLKSAQLKPKPHLSEANALSLLFTVYPKKYAHGFCFAVLCCGYTLTDFTISIRLTSLALWQSNDCPSASKATLVNMDKYFMWINYERLHNHNKAKHNKTVCIFLGIYCTMGWPQQMISLACPQYCSVDMTWLYVGLCLPD